MDELLVRARGKKLIDGASEHGAGTAAVLTKVQSEDGNAVRLLSYTRYTLKLQPFDGLMRGYRGPRVIESC